MLLRPFAALVAALSLFAAPALAQTASYPTKPIRLIVPFPPGAGTDTVARFVAQKLGEALKTSIVVDNRTGAGGAIGTVEAARAEPDGYTLLFVASPFTTVAAASATAGYDPVRQFVPVAPIASGPLAFVVGNAVPAATMKEFLALARQTARRPQLRLGRPRQRQPPGIGAAEGAHRHRHRARPVQGHRAGDAGPARRPDPGDDRVDPGDAALRRAEQAARARGDRQAPRRAAARRAVVAGGGGAGRGRRQLLGHRRAGRHRARDRRAPQRGHAGAARAARRARTPGTRGRRAHPRPDRNAWAR